MNWVKDWRGKSQEVSVWTKKTWANWVKTTRQVIKVKRVIAERMNVADTLHLFMKQVKEYREWKQWEEIMDLWTEKIKIIDLLEAWLAIANDIIATRDDNPDWESQINYLVDIFKNLNDLKERIKLVKQNCVLFDNQEKPELKIMLKKVLDIRELEDIIGLD